MVRSTPSTARTCPVIRLITPDRTGNQVLRPRTSIRGSAIELGAGLRHPTPRELVADLEQRWLLSAAARHRERASRLELAAGRQMDHVGRRAFDRRERLVRFRIEAGDWAGERPPGPERRVRGHLPRFAPLR